MGSDGGDQPKSPNRSMRPNPSSDTIVVVGEFLVGSSFPQPLLFSLSSPLYIIVLHVFPFTEYTNNVCNSGHRFCMTVANLIYSDMSDSGSFVALTKRVLWITLFYISAIMSCISITCIQQYTVVDRTTNFCCRRQRLQCVVPPVLRSCSLSDSSGR